MLGKLVARLANEIDFLWLQRSHCLPTHFNARSVILHDSSLPIGHGDSQLQPCQESVGG